jgi:drug/metabolite transporter (DMT)-like permease
MALVLAARRPALLRIERADLARIGFMGVVGFAGVSAFYFAAIARVQIGVALTVQYLAPLLLLLWLRLIHRRSLRRSLWGVAALSAGGCFLVVRAYSPGSLDGLGLAEACGAAVTFALYLFSTEQVGQRYSPVTTITWGFGFASLFWLVTQPAWTFPWQKLSSPRDALFAAYVVLGGTLVPFLCMISAVRHLPAARAAVVATLEPVLGAVLAWPIHGQTLSAGQIAGGLVTIGAVLWVQTQAPEPESELAPPLRRAAPAAHAAIPPEPAAAEPTAAPQVE